jgi:hypothetical protein
MREGTEAIALLGVAAVLACLVYRSRNAPSASTQITGASFHGGGMRGGFHGVRRGGGVVYVAPSLPTIYEYADEPDVAAATTQALLNELRRRRVLR